MNPTPEQIAKLPKWAREYILRLERQVNDLLEAQEIANSERGTGRLVVNPYRTLQALTLPTSRRCGSTSPTASTSRFGSVAPRWFTFTGVASCSFAHM